MSLQIPEPGTDDPAALVHAHALEVVRVLRAGFTWRKQTNQGVQHAVHRVDSVFEAEDVCHEAIAIVLRQMRNGRFDRTRPVRPYLLRIATNLALRRARLAAREVPTEAELLEGRPVEAGNAPDPLVDAERDALVRDFVGQLDTGERAVLRLTFEAGESQAAAAGVLGLSRDQVYRTMVRIRTSALRFFRERGHLDDA